MTESSAFWDGTTVGDANAGAYTAPYDATAEFNRIFSRALGSDQQGFVIPNLLNNLRVQASAPAAATVDVLSGGALVKGFHYLNDAPVAVTIAANASGSPRIDRIVLRITWATQLIRLAVVQGTPSATPTLPALTQVVGTTWEMPLAYVWVANGFATITDPEIHEERAFMQTMHEANGSDLTGHNLIINSEFMAYSDLIAAPPTLSPEGWDLFGTIPTIVSATKYVNQPRGRALQMTAGGANRGLAQTFNVPASTMIAIKVPIKVNAGFTGTFEVTTNSAGPQTITRTLRRTGSFVEETIFYITEADATTMTIREYCNALNDVVTLGQTVAAIGYFPGKFREIHENLIFKHPLTDTSWDGDAKSSSTTTITLSASFGAFILAGTKALFARVTANDSGSAGTGVAIGLMMAYVGTGLFALMTSLKGVPNDAILENDGVIPLNAAIAFDAIVVATGASTLDAYISISGIMT